ncbi:MAG: hypothetical protein ACK5MQ_08990, partial [Pikeienuella sp.]
TNLAQGLREWGPLHPGRSVSSHERRMFPHEWREFAGISREYNENTNHLTHGRSLNRMEYRLYESKIQAESGVSIFIHAP